MLDSRAVWRVGISSVDISICLKSGKRRKEEIWGSVGELGSEYAPE